MIPLFVEDTDGTPMKRKVSSKKEEVCCTPFCPAQLTRVQFVQPRRNYAAIEYLEETGDLVFDIRVEKEQGGGETKR